MRGDLTLLRPIYDEGEIGVLRVRNPTLQVRGQRRLRELGVALLGQHEVVKVIEPLHTIVATEDVKAVLHNLTSVAEAT